MVLSRKKRQKLRAELNNNNETNPENPKTTNAVKNEIVTGKKRKRGNKGSDVEGKVGISLLKVGENKTFDANSEIDRAKKVKIGISLLKNGEKKIIEVNGVNDKGKKGSEVEGKIGISQVVNGEKVVSLNSDGDKKKIKKKKKKKKKYKKKKSRVEEPEKLITEVNEPVKPISEVNEPEKLENEVENGGMSEQIVDEISSKGNNGDAKKVYVGGMPYYSSEDDIRSYFGQCGAITDIDCMIFPETGKFRGIAIISFETEEGAENALQLDGSDMGGLYLTTQPYKTSRPTKTSNFSPPVIEGYNRIYAGNLSWDITEDDLRKFFSDCNISAIRFGEDKETGDFKGYAHVDFADGESLNKALKLDQKFVCGRPVKISRAVPRKGATTNGVSASTALKPANSGLNSVVIPEINNGGANAALTPEITSGVSSDVTPENNIVVNEILPPPPETKTGVSSGKLKRRTCYDCGERGHISSDCPKKQNS